MRKRSKLKSRKQAGHTKKHAVFRKGPSPFQLFFSFYTARVK
jgi:hypothetical protein